MLHIYGTSINALGTEDTANVVINLDFKMFVKKHCFLGFRCWVLSNSY